MSAILPEPTESPCPRHGTKKLHVDTGLDPSGVLRVVTTCTGTDGGEPCRHRAEHTRHRPDPKLRSMHSEMQRAAKIRDDAAAALADAERAAKSAKMGNRREANARVSQMKSAAAAAGEHAEIAASEHAAAVAEIKKVRGVSA